MPIFSRWLMQKNIFFFIKDDAIFKNQHRKFAILANLHTELTLTRIIPIKSSKKKSLISFKYSLHSIKSLFAPTTSLFIGIVSFSVVARFINRRNKKRQIKWKERNIHFFFVSTLSCFFLRDMTKLAKIADNRRERSQCVFYYSKFNIFA